MERIFMGNASRLIMSKHCCYCGREFNPGETRTNEHLVPLSKKGIDYVENKQKCCSECNKIRGNKDYDLWLMELRYEASQLCDIGKVGAFAKHKVDMMIRNVKYWQEYVRKKGARLIVKNERPIKQYNKKII